MSNHLICDNCNHKNAVNSERIVFCKSCDKKLENNYLDWKKAKFSSSFDLYVENLKEYNEHVNKKTILKSAISKKKAIFKSSVSAPSKKSLIFITSVIVQLLLLVILTHQDDKRATNTRNTASYNYSITNSPSSYTSDVKWGNYLITQTLSLSLPFQLKESESVLPHYMENYVSNHTSQKSESSQSFSVTIEKMNFDGLYKIKQEDIISVTDEYMKSSGVDILKEEGLHTSISGYKTYVEHGSYFKDGSEYLYENYTLTKGDEGVKIILSYLKHDLLLCKYAGIVTQSLLKNKNVI